MAGVSVPTTPILLGGDGVPEKSSDLPKVTQLRMAEQAQTPGFLH